MKNISRRKFLVGGGISAAAVLTGSIFSLENTTTGFIKVVIRSNLPDLNIPESILDKFSADFQNHIAEVKDTKWLAQYRFMQYFYSSKTGFNPSRFSISLKSRESRIVKYFLLSTNVMHDKRVVENGNQVAYMSFWYPGKSCGNPFADLSLPDVS